MNLTVRKAKVLHRKGHTDYCILETDYPGPWPESISSEPLTTTFEVPIGQGERYLREVLGFAEVEIIQG